MTLLKRPLRAISRRPARPRLGSTRSTASMHCGRSHGVGRLGVTICPSPNGSCVASAFGNNTWCAWLSMARVFANWLRGFDPHTEVPQSRLISGKLRGTRLYFYTDDQVAEIVTEAAQLPSSYGLRGWTCSMLFGLIGAYSPCELGTIRPAPVHCQHSRDAPTRLVFSISTAECPPDEIASERSAACGGDALSQAGRSGRAA